MGIIVDGDIPRTLTDSEVKFLNFFPLEEDEKQRVQKVWQQSEESVADYFMPSPKGAPLFLDIMNFGLLIWFIQSPFPLLKTITGIIGWILVLMTFFASNRLKIIYAKKVFLTLSLTNLIFYYEGGITRILYHIVKIGTMILLWKCDRIGLATGTLIATLVSIYHQGQLKTIIKADLTGKRDVIIETMNKYSLKDFGKIARESRR